MSIKGIPPFIEQNGACIVTAEGRATDFHPSNAAGVNEAKKICEEDCEVWPQCLEYALEEKQRYGVWGGTSERQRAKFQAAIRTGELTVSEAVEQVTGVKLENHP